MNTRECEPYRMQSVLGSHLSSPLLNKLPNNSQFLVATCLESARIMKNVAGIIGEHKFIIDIVLATLAQGSGTAGAKYECH